MRLGIDPGRVNCGFVLHDEKTGIRINKTHNFHCKPTVTDTIEKVTAFVQQDPYEIFTEQTTTVIIEDQFIGKKTNWINIAIQHTLHALMLQKNIKVVIMQPNYKFKVFPEFRPRYLKNMTAGKRRTITKNKCKELVQKYGPQFNINLKASSHETDAAAYIIVDLWHTPSISSEDINVQSLPKLPALKRRKK